MISIEFDLNYENKHRNEIKIYFPRMSEPPLLRLVTESNERE